ncbi:MAG: hypothetical protein MK108_08505 [Mariniblastus sp.]|nr:hypothetical protein [Mariniblastus sp.]
MNIPSTYTLYTLRPDLMTFARCLFTRMLCVAIFLLPTPMLVCGQEDAHQKLTEATQFRSIGPFRGGRSAAVTGVPGKPMLYYQGAAGGGVWRTTDGGSSWENLSDGFFGGSIGAIEVAPSDPNIIYVGGGEVTVRGNVSHGYGMWKSYDGGQTWKESGLQDSRRIPRIRVHPTNPDLVYAAVLGHLHGPNQERGVYRSRDGGASWERILFVSEEAGAVDLVIDPNNPRVLYASMWKVKRTPYSLESGGEGSGIWKSTDGGDHWTDISRNNGLPKGPLGISGVTVSPVDSNRVWAIVEAPEGGLFRSDDAGKTWKRVNDERKLRQRAWYYTRVYAGPQNIDEVYVLNVRFWRSTDGGSTFSSISTPHGDHHDLWIAPEDPDRMAIADDGGAQVSYSRGKSWSTYMNQPTAQFYRVTTDNHFPYRIYGAQQDNSTVRIRHRTDRGSIGERDWEPTAGGESGHIAPDPVEPDIVYGGSYGGYLTRIDHRTGERRNIHIWPDNPMGHGAGDGKFRFQWNFPIFFSHHHPGTLYAAGNVLFKTEDEGASWQQISPDLTRNDPSKLGSSGGPITQDNTSVEYYCTIFAACESLHEPDVIWVGSDDGLIHVTRDGGKNWSNVTPPGMPEWMQINSIEPHPTEKGGLYVAGTRYKSDDFKPYLYKTTDYGATWQPINNGIDRKHFTRVLRADPVRPGQLFAGTESGLYISTDDGEHWQPFQCNLPVVPITDMVIKNDDLVVATQGRSFWVLDDLSLLRQWKPELLKKPMHLFSGRPVYRMGGGGSRRASATAGQNVPSGVDLHLHLKEAVDEKHPIQLELTDAKGNRVGSYSTKPEKKLKQKKLNLSPGMNLVNWDMRVPGAESFEGMVLWGGGLQGPRVVPGIYTATLTQGDHSETVEFEIRKDPRCSVSDEDLQAQFEFLIGVRDKLTETHEMIKQLREVKGQIDSLSQRLKGETYQAIREQGQEITDRLSAIEKKLYQTQNQSPQDPLNFPIRLNNRLSSLVGVASMGDNAPTRQSIEVRDVLVSEIDALLAEAKQILSQDVQAFNQKVSAANVPAIFVDDQ